MGNETWRQRLQLAAQRCPLLGGTSVGLSPQWKENWAKTGRRSWGEGQLSGVLVLIYCSLSSSHAPQDCHG